MPKDREAKQLSREQYAENLRQLTYLSLTQAADYLGVTERTIRQMIADGRLTGYRLGARVVRLRRDEIDAAMTPFGGAA